MVQNRQKRYPCDGLCIRYMNRECITTNEETMLCDQPDMYREIGDVADALGDVLMEEKWVDKGE